MEESKQDCVVLSCRRQPAQLPGAHKKMAPQLAQSTAALAL